MSSNSINITKQMQVCFDAIENGEKFSFITGAAGTGKSTFLRYFRENSSKELVVLAPTGIAAVNVKGQTIHSFFKFGIGVLNQNNIDFDEDLSEMLQKIDVIVIDEISMVRADLFDAINTAMKKNLKNKEFFGGKQLVVIGDLFQLPPIIVSHEKEYFTKIGYSTEKPFFFGSKSFNPKIIKIFEFTTIFRQKNDKYIKLLNKIRIGSADISDIKKLNEMTSKDESMEDDHESVTLTTKNITADTVNKKKLSEIKLSSKKYHAIKEGYFDMKNCPSPEILELKRGAKVMFTKNGQNYYNGQIGTVYDLKPDIIKVETDNKIIEVEMAKWESVSYKLINGEIMSDSAGECQQFPLRLGYAITIHKSQGCTFNKVVLNLENGTFADGQLYVALSRCTDPSNLLLLRDVTMRDMLVCKAAKLFLSID